MKTVLILSALKTELRPIFKYVSDPKKESYVRDIKFYRCKLLRNNLNLVVASFGMGKVLAALATQYAIDKYSPSRIFLVGACGGFSQKVNKGDILISEKSIQADMDLTSTGKPLGVYQGPDEMNKEKIVNHDQKVIKISRNINF